MRQVESLECLFNRGPCPASVLPMSDYPDGRSAQRRPSSSEQAAQPYGAPRAAGSATGKVWVSGCWGPALAGELLREPTIDGRDHRPTGGLRGRRPHADPAEPARTGPGVAAVLRHHMERATC